MIDKQTIEHIAKLSRLTLSEDEKELYTTQLQSIFAYVETLQEVDTEGVEPTSQVTGLKNVVFDDIVEERTDEIKDKLVESFSRKDNRELVVRQVFDR